MTLNEIFKNTTYDGTLFSEESKAYPLDEEWQTIFKNAYLVLKEIVDLNIEQIQERTEQPVQA